MNAWWVDEDEEFCNDLLRWNDDVIAQVTGEDERESEAAYAALVAAVRGMAAWGEKEWDALDSLLGTTDADWPGYEGGSDRDVLHQALARHQVRHTKETS